MYDCGRLNGPTKLLADRDYFSECVFALEPTMLELLDLAVEAGWDRGQVALALMAIAADMARQNLPPSLSQ